MNPERRKEVKNRAPVLRVTLHKGLSSVPPRTPKRTDQVANQIKKWIVDHGLTVGD